MRPRDCPVSRVKALLSMQIGKLFKIREIYTNTPNIDCARPVYCVDTMQVSPEQIGRVSGQIKRRNHV